MDMQVYRYVDESPKKYSQSSANSIQASTKEVKTKSTELNKNVNSNSNTKSPVLNHRAIK